MCCRYYMEMSPELRPIVERAKGSRLYLNNIQRLAKPISTEGEIFPEALVPVLASDRAGHKRVFPMLWGYHVPGIRRPIVNARVESAGEKPSFRDSWAMHRCVIPASWYYEWDHVPTPAGGTRAGDKYAVMSRGRRFTWLCGLYRLENDYPHFVVLTREASESIAFLHDRMPFILPEEEIDRWIDPNVNPHVLLASAVTDLIFEKEA